MAASTLENTIDEKPNDESLAAIVEGNAFLESGAAGRFSSGRDLIEAALS